MVEAFPKSQVEQGDGTGQRILIVLKFKTGNAASQRNYQTMSC